MVNTMFMGTSLRHNRLVADIYRRLANYLEELIYDEKVLISLEQLALCYYGTYRELETARLIDARNFTTNDLEIINDFSTIQPDIMIFKNNPWISNKRNTRYIGQPDLIVEVWSDTNDIYHQSFKKNLYSSSPVTEHWYMSQDSNKVECRLGKELLPYQSLENILITQDGVKIDLRRLKL